MKLTRKQRRAADRHVGRRERTRQARAKAARVVQLDAEGFGAAAIASSTGLTERTVRAVLKPGEGEDPS